MEYATIFEKNGEYKFAVNQCSSMTIAFKTREEAKQHAQYLLENSRRKVRIEMNEYRAKIEKEKKEALLNEFLKNYSKFEAGKMYKTLTRVYNTEFGILPLWVYAVKNNGSTHNKTVEKFSEFLKTEQIFEIDNIFFNIH